MNLLTKLRLPYRDDVPFQILSFAVFFVPLVFYAAAFESYESVKISLWALCLAAFIFVTIWQRKKLQLNRKMAFLFVLMFVWMVICCVFSASWRESLFGDGHRYNGLIFFLLFSMFVLALSSSLKGSKDKVVYLIKLLSIDALLISILGIAQSFSFAYYEGINSLSSLFRGPSFTGNPDFSGIFLATILPLGIFLFFKEQSKKLKYFWAICTFVNIWGLIIFASRGSLIVVGIELLLVLFVSFWQKNKRLFTIAISCLAIASIALLSLLFLPIIRGSLAAASQQSVDLRLLAWKDSASQILKHPVLGVGLGQVIVTVPQDSGGYFDDVHNFFLQRTLEGGFPLLIIFLAIIFYFVRPVWKDIRPKLFKGAVIDEMGFYLLLADLGFIITICFAPLSAVSWLIFAVLIATHLALYYGKDEQWLEYQINGWIFGLLALFYIIYALAFVTGEILLFKGSYDYQNNVDTYQKQTLLYTKLAQYMCPSEYMAGFYYLSEYIYAHKDSPDLGREKILEYTKRYSSIIPFRWQLANLYEQMYIQDGSKDDLRMAVQYRIETAQIFSAVGDMSKNLALEYFDLGDLSNAKTVLLKAINHPGITNPKELWVLLAKVQEAQGASSDVIIYDLNQAFLLEPSDIQLMNVLQRSRKDPSYAIQFLAGVY